MTTTSASVGFIDYVAFGLTPESLRSLRALAPVWKNALTRVVERFGGGGVLDQFVERTAELPLLITDVAWQREWMQAWYKLSGSGFSLAEMFGMFNHAVACCEADLFGDSPQVGRVQLDLFAILRRSVVAAISCAIELGEEVRVSAAGLPGEFAAMRQLHEMAKEGGEIAVLSVSMVNLRAFSHFSAIELQTIPSLLTEQLSGLLRAQDRAFVGHEGVAAAPARGAVDGPACLGCIANSASIC